MDASFPGGSHWASWSEAMREAPSMMGLHAAGTANVERWLLGVLFVGSTAESTATWKNVRDTCYAVTSCTKGALPGGDSASYVSFHYRTGTGAFQTNWKEVVGLLENYQNCP